MLPNLPVSFSCLLHHFLLYNGVRKRFSIGSSAGMTHIIETGSTQNELLSSSRTPKGSMNITKPSNRLYFVLSECGEYFFFESHVLMFKNNSLYSILIIPKRYKSVQGSKLKSNNRMIIILTSLKY